MGAIPNDIHQAIEILKTDPDRAHWSHRRCICLTKTSNGKLGIKVDIIEGNKETFSIVTKVKPECCLGRGDVLHLLDRILFINRQDVRLLAPNQLWKFLSSLSTPVIEVLVCSLVSISSKRSRDQVSNSSCRSFTGMRKGPDNKRRPVESEPLLQGQEGQQSPEIRPFLDSNGLRSGSCDENWTTSLPTVDSRTQAITDINGRTCSSLPATMSSQLLVKPSTNTNDLLRFPHFIHWDPITKTVSLTRGARGSFGFKFKVKMSKNADDLYTLVECITPEGPADGKLMVGDWIRSVNGQPLQSPREASSIPELLAKETTVRIVLQRPEGLSQNIFPPTPSLPDPDVHYPSVPGNPLASEQPKMPAYQRLPTHNSGKGRPVSCDTVQRGGKSYRVTPLPESSDPQDPQDISVDLFELNRTVNLPKVRVFLCGSEARALARLLLPGVLSSQSDNSSGLYQCIKCTMGMDREGAISFTSWSSFDYLVNDESSSRLHASNESLTKSDIFRDRDETSSFIHNGSINVELFIMPDDRFTPEDKFFHHCCQYLFTRTSIFVLTFDGAKVVTSTHTEIQRLQNVIHTIRCFDGYECPILTYGLLYNDATVGVDEVRTLFYLPFGQQIQKYNVPMPELFCPGVDGTEAKDVSRRLQRGLWKVLGEMTLKQKISLPSVAMMLQFEAVRSGEQKLFIDEVEFSGMYQDEVPGGGQDLQQIVWTDLKNVGEILSSKAAPLTLPHVQHLDKFLFIDPKVLLDCVQNVNVFLQQLKGVQSLEGARQKGVRGLSTGVITEEDLIDIISQQCHNNSVEKIIHLLEIFGLIFRQKSPCTDSGGMNYLVPYLITDQSTLAPPTTEPTELCLYVDFRTHTSSLVFYQLAFAINNSSDSHSLTMIGPASCCLSHLGYDLTLHHHKLRDRIQINLARSEAAAKPYVLYQWLHKVCKATLGSEVKYVLGPSCPLQERCFFISQHHSDMHVLDLSKRQICCSEKLENHRKVKLWLSNMIGKYVNELPHTILRMISQKLHLNTTFGNDWKLLGGLLGLTGDKIALYDTHKEPAYQLLMDQGRSHRLTLALLLELLQHPDMERRDITSGIEDWLDSSPQTP
ncbi:uncharacterized protein LOC117330827 [Pecten maximus]|uniref:uncharacterized protein LOC117330827 n=1 Tax=Pecten maximus TaxID=6579 RepID=UPI0014586561|nr:uncharacterized protein LOC117330827 [Pecten maximus]XP_033745231.1 uncharacterized protein LOC117330827 [Pecten maximus]XP_033745232.1 uncharacterized protein LOC117330827 [Pecten maximus]XP_033745233.1 uncharacterized protein LOC117330827 [Pecten maximus]XP_033745234.1 uncharacterized protein LOC117330827 [Pecten maximus]XP_033745235.1 uncharacterized protein LOC117330827 [Pecten maximus]XP_033745237.1 uncharacterized protein LOC117330827 [Pecten maximus]XP_033745238.1 uncharacterized p